MNRKINLAITTAQDRLASLDFEKNMSVGKQGTFRHNAGVFLKACDDDEHKKSLPEVIYLKSEHKLFQRSELIAPENISKTATMEICKTIALLLNAKKNVPSQPFKVVLWRLADDSCKVARVDKDKCKAYLVIIFPHWTLVHEVVVGNKVFDVMTNCISCISCLSSNEKYEIWDNQFLDGYFVPLISNSAKETILMVCETVNDLIVDTLQNNEDIEDEQAEILNEYGEIMKMIPAAFAPADLLTDKFWQHVQALLDFCSSSSSIPLRYRKISAALQDHTEIQETLADCNTTLLNRQLIEEPLTELTTAVSNITAALNSDDSPSDAQQTDMLPQTVTALGCLQQVQLHIGKTFSAEIEKLMKTNTTNLMQQVCGRAEDEDPSQRPSKELLNASQRVLGECSNIWPFGGQFEEQQQTIAHALRGLTASQDQRTFLDALDKILALKDTDGMTKEMLQDFLEKINMVDLTRIETATRTKLRTNHGRLIYSRLEPMLCNAVCLYARISFSCWSERAIERSIERAIE